ncbi:ABC transporter substrate-binding protein [Caldicellulosiruptor acetigenus]|uniref:ABC transporter substrate-binding protein n=1 Tax=Caldicellulosiruptor acetigenus TaxID=301953 RepID=UPI0003F6A727|nr:extracellular solute-binding protein [Caldicellulosiruptor acetigenus]WAM36416.1 extracellular solute-binding protein [Caldicellulosiruptor acetigenus]
MKRVISIAIVSLVILSLVLVGGVYSGNVTKAATKEGKITIWAWDPNFNIAIMNEASNRYKKINPKVKFEIANMAKADVEQKLNTVLASGVKTGLPEIVLIEDYNAQKYLTSYPGAFADLTKHFNYKDFAQYKVSLMTLKGKVYGVPFDSGVVGWFYRSDYFSKAGFKANDLINITWDKFIEMGKIIKQKTGKYMVGFDPYDGGLMRIMLQSAGRWYFDKNGKVDIANNPVLKEALISYKKVVDSGIAKKVSGWNQWVASFNNGEVASVVTGVWIIGSIKAEKSQSGKWAVAPVPRLNIKGSVNASNLGGSSWYVLQNSKYRDIAIDFLKQIYAKDIDFYQKILIERGAVGTYLPAQKGKAYTASDPFFGGQKIFVHFSNWMKNIPSVNYGLYTYEADSAIMAVMPDVYSGKLSVDAALKKAEEQFKNKVGQ